MRFGDDERQTWNTTECLYKLIRCEQVPMIPASNQTKKQNEIVGMGSGKSEQRFGEFQPFILHHIGIFVFDILQKSKQQINFLFIER